MNWSEISLVCGALLALIAVATFILRKVVPWLRKWSRVADRILGVPADPATGQAAIPSIWERLDHQDQALAVIKHEVEYNNGSSIKDAVRRTETKLDTHLASLPLATAAPAVVVNTGTPA